MSRSLVIGGTLFIGRALVRRLLARGDEVTILHRGRSNPFAGQVGEIHCDRNDVDGMQRALGGRRFDFVFDNVYDWQRGTTAEQVSAAAIACSEGLKRYVFVSSVAAYGEGLDRDEDDSLAPLDHPELYVRNKAESERALFGLHRNQGIPVATLRPPYIYGPENPFYREAFFWDRLAAERPIVIPGDGSRLMQFVHVDDVARAAILAADKDAAVGRAYNVANERALTQLELVHLIARAAGTDHPDLVHVPRERIEASGGGIFEPPFYFGQYFDLPAITQKIDRARRELGFEPTPFSDGLAESFQWYERQQGRPAADFSWEEKLLADEGAGTA